MIKNNFYDERLPFPTKLVRAPIGIVEEYIIPFDKKQEVLCLTGPDNQSIFNVYTWRLNMVTKIQKWGNSLGLRIPKSFAKEAGVEEGSAVDIFLEGDRLVIRPVRRERYRLSDLMSQVRKDNIHEEISTGDTAGREAW